MRTLRITAIILILFTSISLEGQVKVRLFSEANPDYFFFTVLNGSFRLDIFNNSNVILKKGETILISRYKNNLAIKIRGLDAVKVDSLCFRGNTGRDVFSIYSVKGERLSGNYSGDLLCRPDFGGILLINTCNTEEYIAGVVKSEGGNGKSREYFKTQAVIARTYTYKYLNRHIADGYNLCDDIHCQVFNGVISDTLILGAVKDTRDLVITTPDSNLIIAAFHSNCGGETSPSEYVWLTSQPYLVRIEDPYCLNSKNAKWKKTVSVADWEAMLGSNGISVSNGISYEFGQPVRQQTYTAGEVSLPLRNIREYFNLRSTFFSVTSSGDSLSIIGKGYGHGVGLCQEGAIAMAASGRRFTDIIGFYYPGVRIMKVSEAKKDENYRVLNVNSSVK